MNSAHLFAGIGGGILADLALGNQVVVAVEINPFCRAVLQARQNDGSLPKFPIFEDVRTFQGDEIDGKIDLVCGGFPCQDVSVAGKGRGLRGEKSSLFFEVARICRRIRPQYVFLENSPALVSRGLDEVLGTFAEIGYDVEWTTLSALDVGAPHKRDRWWGLFRRRDVSDADAKRQRQPPRRFENVGNGFGDVLPFVSDADGSEQMERREKRLEKTSVVGLMHGGAAFPGTKSKCFERLARLDAGDWRAEPGVRRVADGVPVGWTELGR